MTAPTGSLFSTHSNRIEEVINKNIQAFLPTLDPVWRDNIVTNQGVAPSGDLGRDWKVLKVFTGSLTGVIEAGAPRADFALYGDNQDTTLGAKVHLKGLSNTFPDAMNSPNASPYRLGIPMRSMVTNLPMTLGELQADATQAFIGNVIAPKMEGFARNVAHTLSNFFYLSQNDNYRLTVVADVSADIVGSASATWLIATISIANNGGAIDRFAVGQRLNAWTSANAQVSAASGEVVFVVTYVDELAGEIQIRCQDGTAIGTSATAGPLFTAGDNMYLTFAGAQGSSAFPSSSTAFTGIAGINSWLKDGSGGDDGNILLGAESDSNNEIDVTIHPEFKSFGHSLGSVPLTEHKLRQIIRRWQAAKGKYGMDLDTFIASDGVWLAYEAQKIGREWLDRTGRLSNVNNEGSQEGFNFTFGGRSYKGQTSMYVEGNTVYGIKVGGGNWKRYVPPDFNGVSNDPRQVPFVPFRFVAGALRGDSVNQLPIYQNDTTTNRSLVTEGVQMPGWMRMQLVPDQIPMLKLTNVTEDRLWSDN